MTDTAQAIREARKANGLSQTALAERLGVKQSAVSQWERGRYRPDLESCRKLHDALEIPLAVLVGEGAADEEPPAPQQPSFTRTYLLEWRKYRGFSLRQLAPLVGLSGSRLSQIERGEQPYHQRLLEACAQALGCSPSDLLTRAPGKKDGEAEIDQQRLARVISAGLSSTTDPDEAAWLAAQLYRGETDCTAAGLPTSDGSLRIWAGTLLKVRLLAGR